MTKQNEHAFAQYVRILGKGKNGTRSLTFDEAYQAMHMIMHDQVEPMQLGAFLMLLRVKEESAEEIGGFVKAVREYTTPPTPPLVDLDWSSYAGKRRHLPWYILSALLLAQHGYKIFMHGSSPHTPGRMYSEDVLSYFDYPIPEDLQTAHAHLETFNFAYAPLELFAPKLQDIIDFKPLLGLRSPVHTIARLVNPCDAKHSMQGIFHPGYQDIHQGAAVLLNEQHSCVFKGEGGEAEFNPDAGCDVYSVNQGKANIETWPPQFSRRHVKNEAMDLALLEQVWSGNSDDEYGLAAILGTTAIALRVMQKAHTQEDALSQANELWQQRNRHSILAKQ
jgi:anthranilate phosphoribosyltransferase